MALKDKYEATELLFSAHARCRCGAGLAYPMRDEEWAKRARMWMCAAVLMDTVPADEKVSARGPFAKENAEAKHDAYEWWCYEIKSEGQPSANGATTRPPGHHIEWKPELHCRKCDTKWDAPPVRPHLDRNNLPPCPKCGETYLMPQGYLNPNIDARFPDIVVEGD